MTLRRRVLAYMALAAVASCALTVAVAVVLVRHRVSSQRMSALQAQAEVVAVIGGAPGARNAGEHVYRVGAGKPTRVRPRLARAVLAAIPGSGDGEGTLSVAGRSLLYAARTTLDGRVVLVRAGGLAFAQWRPFLSSLLLAGLGGAALATLLSFLLARRLTRPIAALAAATRRVAAGEPAVEIPVHGEDELAALGHSFNHMSAELGRARESQRAFLESVSHELKTPLTSIRGYAEAVAEDAVAPAEGGRIIGAEADRLERLVFDLLDLARLGRAGFAVEHREIDLTTIASAAVTRHLPRARELGVELDCTAETGSLSVGDPGRLLQATSNLIENALRLTPAGGCVQVLARPGEITVRDTGPGLAADDLPRAFDRFYLYDRYRSERAVGSGLGLAIVKELTAAMGGGVRAANRVDGGAEFTITLPIA
ncbi:MAG TPA: HAMP domain-containing sensor histidine kinase [Solirubrobacteraceae bacterium]